MGSVPMLLLSLSLSPSFSIFLILFALSLVISGFIPEIQGAAGGLGVFCAGLLFGVAHCWLAERLTFWGFELGDSYFESGFGF